MRLIRPAQAARMLGVTPTTLNRRAAGRNYLEIYGHRLTVYRMDIGPGAEGRYDADEIERILEALRRVNKGS